MTDDTEEDGPERGGSGVVTPFPAHRLPPAEHKRRSRPFARSAPEALVLDITRSVKRVRHRRQTGIDRVEMRHAEHARGLGRPLWLIASISGRQCLLPPDASGPFLDELAAINEADDPHAPLLPRADFAARTQLWRDRKWRLAEAAVRRHALNLDAGGWLGLPGREGDASMLRALTAALPKGAVYLNVGHDNLQRPLLEALAQAGIARAVLLHDAIPLTHPEYTVPEAAQRFRRRFDAALTADAIIANSNATADSVEAVAVASKRSSPPVTVAPLGINPPSPVADPPPEDGAAASGAEAARFVMLGTIEGRKNHLLMLALWRGLSDVAPGQQVPELHIIGRRGWAAEQVFQMLDHAPMMGWSVFEHGELDDAEVAGVFAGARALLFPSFVEGFGLPVGEALAAGLPVIAADLPALHEVGGEVPEWLSPLDGKGWLDAIRDYAQPRSSRRAAQLDRMADWRPPGWDAHFEAVEEALGLALDQAAASFRPRI
ncbi:MAG: glycosyltransferase family 1 protein [Pseudomonadota bacterium]